MALVELDLFAVLLRPGDHNDAFVSAHIAINGLTGREIVDAGLDKIEAVARETIAAAEQEVADLTADLVAEEERARAELSEIDAYYQEGMLRVNATLRNNFNFFIEAVEYEVAVYSEGRPVPWRGQTVTRYSFDGGLAPGESRSFLACSWYARDLNPTLDYLPELRVIGVLGPGKAPRLAWLLSEHEAEHLERSREHIREAESQLQKVATHRRSRGEPWADPID
ncbi:MAG: hypothetical protein AAF711_00035 [Planctomycetota bacterium]